MGVQFILVLVLSIFKVETFPIKVFQVKQRQTKDYQVFKDILIQNLIVTTDNLKLILNWEREDTLLRVQDEERFNTKLIKYDNIMNLSPLPTTSKNDLTNKLDDEVPDGIVAQHDTPGSHTTKDIPISTNNFGLSKYLAKKSPNETDKPIEYEIKSEIEEEDEEKENFEDIKALVKGESNKYSPIILSEESNTSGELDNNLNSEYDFGKAKRQADGENPLPIPTGDGDTQMFMGTFQAVMRPMKLPSLGYRCTMQSPSQSECVVSGALCLMLRMSQIAGVAPLSFRRTNAGWCVRVSHAASLYGRTLSFTLWFLSTLTIALDILIEPERSYRTRTNSTRIVWVADVSTVGLVVSTAAFTGLMRMEWLTVYLLKLQEINLKLSIYREVPSHDGRRMLIVITSMICTCSTILLDYGIYIYQVVTHWGKVVTSCLYIFYNISTAVQQIILLTFFETATSVLTSLHTLNNCLKDLLQEILNNSPEAKHAIISRECRIDMYTINNKSINSVVDTMTLYRGSTNPSPKSIPTTVRRLCLLYCSICDVLREVNDSHGVVLAALLLCLLLHLVITPYHVITTICIIFNRSRSDRSSPVIQLTWCVLHFLNLLLVIEPCHRTHDAMELTRHLVSQMMRYTPSEDSALLLELQMFYQHLMLNEMSYAPLKMFHLNRTLIVTILGSITTYLVVVVQL